MRIPMVGELSAKLAAVFVALWLAVGFASGTVTLLGPVRWMTTYLRDAGWGGAFETGAVLSVIAGYVALSAWISWKLSRWVVDTERPHIRFGVPAAAWAAAAGCLWLWMTPAVMMRMQSTEVSSVARFTFGPYPDRARFQQLVDEGYAGVVTLLHPAVVPFEPTLLEQERELAAEFGVKLVHAPMLPWVADNADSLAKIRSLVEEVGGRFYVHCYLGKDRVCVVRQMVERSYGVDRIADVRGDRERPKFTMPAFERGPIHQVDRDVYLTPYPTDEEFFNTIVDGTFEHVVSLLDPGDRDDAQWIDKEREIMTSYSMPYTLMPLSWHNLDPAAVLEVAERVRRLPRPVLVHAFRSEGSVSESFRLAYHTGLASVSPGSFDRALLAGQAQVVAANVVLGPRPTRVELGAFLAPRGIRGILYVGDPHRPEAEGDRQVAVGEAKLEWRVFEPDSPGLLEALATDGPWYVYGPSLGAVQRRIQRRFSGQLRVLQEPLPADAAGGM
ncbi:MAG TPA: hypothetical protein QGG47_03180 [Acidobacteriota bacterium]|nr:hypothetical protein [Acidobacteriota bacterium]